MKKVYLVSKGDYSDYHIVAAFSKRGLAEGFVKKWGERIEELEVDRPGRLIDRGYQWYEVRMDRQGNVLKVEGRGADGNEWAKVEFDTFYCEVLAKSEKAAIKITNEKRVVAVALGAFDLPGD